MVFTAAAGYLLKRLSSSSMGILMMVGVVVNNSILLVEFANRRRAEGLAPREAAFALRGRRRAGARLAAVRVLAMVSTVI